MARSRRHLIIPDTQVKPGIPMKHFEWLGQAIKDYQPDRIIHLGDHWDFESVSRHNSPKDKEGKRIIECAKAGNTALSIIDEFSNSYRASSMHILRGNHEYRLTRYVDEHPELEGVVGFDELLMDKEYGWTPVEYSLYIS